MLTRPAELVYSINVAYHMYAALAQSVERRLGKAEVGGSIPLGSSKMFENKDFSRNYSSKSLYFYSSVRTSDSFLSSICFGVGIS